ncbi:carbohydrate ABC transporter permease [Nocardiopsis composta]|uniref:N,N'-diacetylchitobiose transport system permease protein n=1 Tax=Nocardiopsis composta TaxID=157465 RepID=A0A7W8QTL3_9ACTN|nr:sugar ABC transporter permease [Nocardiopsis composta]MBB5435381.1 N,N'-diacetylchitobiose transport system permease protein [Nocardiopsis composta]
MSETATAGRPAPAAPQPSPKRRRRLSLTARRRALPWALLAPGLLVIGGLLLYPLGRVLWLSVQDYGLRELFRGGTNFVGAENYLALLADSYLWRIALPNTVFFAVVAVGATVVFGTLVALLLSVLRPLARTIVISCIMVAWAMPAVSGTYVWVWIFDVDRGIVRQGLEAAGALGPEGFNWFADRLAFYAIVTLNIVHHGFPFVAVTVLAGLLTVPKELYEAAVIDGAGAWQRFWNVTVPTLRPVFAVVTILSTIWDFKVFAQVFLMPGGDGANPSMLNFGVWSYQQGIVQSAYGTGAAIAVLLTVMLLVVTVVYLRALFREEELR